MSGRYELGTRLMLAFYNRGKLTGHAAIICMRDAGKQVVDVMRVTRQDHDTDHAPTHYRRLTVYRARLRVPTAAELGDESWRRLWAGLELERERRAA